MEKQQDGEEVGSEDREEEEAGQVNQEEGEGDQVRLCFLLLAKSYCLFYPGLRIRIRMFLGLLDLDPYSLVRSTVPDPSIIKQK